MEHRKQYRVQPGKDNVIQVNLISDTKKPVSAELVDINIGGMGLRMAREDCPDLTVGQQVKISLKPSQSGEPVMLTAIVNSQADGADYRRLGFSFVASEVDQVASSEELFNLFNRRRKKRIEPGQGGDIEVAISSSPEWHD